MSKRLAGKKFRARSEGRYGKRHITGQMNKTETKYAEFLWARLLNGEIQGWWFERMTLKAAEDCRYTTDFMVLNNDGTLDLVDVKGPKVAAESLVKIRTCADQFWMFNFHVMQLKGGQWKHIEF